MKLEPPQNWRGIRKTCDLFYGVFYRPCVRYRTELREFCLYHCFYEMRVKTLILPTMTILPAAVIAHFGGVRFLAKVLSALADLFPIGGMHIPMVLYDAAIWIGAALLVLPPLAFLKMRYPGGVQT